MVGKAYFYKGEFDEAAKTFSFIIEEYKKTPIVYEASLWLSRCFIEKKDFVAAESILIDLTNNRKFPEKLEKDFEKINIRTSQAKSKPSCYHHRNFSFFKYDF